MGEDWVKRWSPELSKAVLERLQYGNGMVKTVCSGMQMEEGAIEVGWLFPSQN